MKYERAENLIVTKAKQSNTSRMVSWLAKNLLFVFVVVVPTICAAIYYSLASDVYVSESEFVVRSPQKNTGTGLGALLQSSGFSRSQDDVYAIQDYIESHDVVGVLNHEFDLKKMYGGSNIFYLNRFGVFGNTSFEHLNKYFLKNVHLELDSSSSIVTLQIKAYTAQDAHKLNERMLELSEDLVNKINNRGRSDQIRYAQNEVDRAKVELNRASNNLAAYRNKQHVFDTDKQSALQLQQVSKLQDQLSSTTAQINQIKAVAPDNPQIEVLENLRKTLQGQINQQMTGVAGNDASLSAQTAEYQKLQLDNSVAERQLASAMTSLESIRGEAQRKDVYIERIQQPSIPDEALEPMRLKGVAMIFVFCLILWQVLGMFVASVKEHRD